MQRGKLNVVIDAQWGSTGKGKVCDYLAETHNLTDLVSSNMPNAGHTVVRSDKKFVMKVLPSGAPFSPSSTQIWLTGSSGFYAERLEHEIGYLASHQLHIHERAFTVNESHAQEELGLTYIASTMQGSGAALCDKIMRRSPTGAGGPYVDNKTWRTNLYDRVKKGKALFEISQGWGLSLDHGTHYPQCTSRNCSVSRALDDCAIPPHMLGEVVAVVRPYPIRVGNTEGGNSGGWCRDNTEVDWRYVEASNALVPGLAERERTTVTKRIRRVATFSYDLLKDCCKHNGVTGIFLNFANYIDPSCAGKRGKREDAPTSVRIFANSLEIATGIPVIAYGTGADTFDVLD